jgi:plastocyanin
MMSKRRFGFLALTLVLLVLGSILLSACSQTATPSSGTTVGGSAPASGNTGGNGEPTVHMNASSFEQSTVTVPKGLKLKLIDNGAYLHILQNGTWQNGTPTPGIEPGAPVVNNVHVNGSTIISVEIGPFNEAGTFNIYCTVNPGMTLTITVLDTHP